MINYFNNISTRSYPTTLGDFIIEDMTSYFTVNDSQFITTDLTIDNTDTLIEASKKIYDDIDSFWLFLFANKKINPFDLLEPNSSLVQSTISELTGLQLLEYNTSEDAIFTNGSLIFPKTENTGSSWEYGSTGEFDLDGGFALIDSYNPFSKRAVVKYIEGFTLANANAMGPLKGLVSKPTGYSWYDKEAEINEITPALVVADAIKYDFSSVAESLTTAESLIEVKSEYPLNKKVSGQAPYEPVGTGGVSISIQQTLQTRIPSIKAYLIGSLRDASFNKVIQNYQV